MRKQGKYLSTLELENKKDERANSIKTIRYRIDVLKIDLEISALDLEDASRTYEEYKRLYENKIAGENEYMLKKLDYELAASSSAELKSEYYTLMLQLFSAEGVSIHELLTTGN